MKWFLFVSPVWLRCCSRFVCRRCSPLRSCLGARAADDGVPPPRDRTILRYHLYDIDRVVSRAVGYTLVTAILAAAFGVAVIVMQSVLAPVTESSTLAVVASTLIVAALFQPVRSAIQTQVDRRFDRSGVNAERLVTTFGETLRDETDLPTIHDTLVATARATWAPATVGVWVRPAG